MDRALLKSSSCAVCGAEAADHSGWFLLVENRWLDSLKVLFWHPLLAENPEMQSVCNRRHLKTLITHWLTQANLDYSSEAGSCLPLCDADPAQAETGPTYGVGGLVGELAVYRESLSHVWNGSPETLECILTALIGGLASKTPPPTRPPVEHSAEYSAEYALQ